MTRADKEGVKHALAEGRDAALRVLSRAGEDAGLKLVNSIQKIGLAFELAEHEVEILPETPE